MSTQRIACALACAAVVACHDTQADSPENFSRALDAYLAERGELCVGKSEWPIDVTAREAELGTRDAKQMPVLERLGLVTSSDAVARRKDEDQTFEVPVRRYELTPAGREFYHARSEQNAQGDVVAGSDLCVAKLTREKLVSSHVTNDAKGRRSAVLWYTYRVTPAPWTADPEFLRVFPAVAHVLAGAGKAELREEVTLTADGWVALELLGGAKSPSPAASQASAR
ncbi:MAG TPA: hypothetical protein VMI54_05115 [Polyangiaceae bacterium]|nr:hypothetical protein [Polyangiaceae bacterium]